MHKSTPANPTTRASTIAGKVLIGVSGLLLGLFLIGIVYVEVKLRWRLRVSLQLRLRDNPVSGFGGQIELTDVHQLEEDVLFESKTITCHTGVAVIRASVLETEC